MKLTPLSAVVALTTVMGLGQMAPAYAETKTQTPSYTEEVITYHLKLKNGKSLNLSPLKSAILRYSSKIETQSSLHPISYQFLNIRWKDHLAEHGLDKLAAFIHATTLNANESAEDSTSIDESKIKFSDENVAHIPLQTLKDYADFIAKIRATGGVYVKSLPMIIYWNDLVNSKITGSADLAAPSDYLIGAVPSNYEGGKKLDVKTVITDLYTTRNKAQIETITKTVREDGTLICEWTDTKEPSSVFLSVVNFIKKESPPAGL